MAMPNEYCAHNYTGYEDRINPMWIKYGAVLTNYYHLEVLYYNLTTEKPSTNATSISKRGDRGVEEYAGTYELLEDLRKVGKGF